MDDDMAGVSIAEAPARSDLGDRPPANGRRVAWAFGALAACYLAAFALTWPTGLVVSDEAGYVGQAELFSRGDVHWETLHPVLAVPASLPLSDYPPGTALVQLPFVAAGGWPAGALASAVCLLVTVVLLARWLRDEGRSPWFAALLLVNPVALVMGRLAMSDVPSMLVVTASVVAFWRGLDPPARRWAWPVAGFLAGLSMSFRDANPLVPAVFLAGALLRRERLAWTGLVAAAAGGAVRLGLYGWVLGDALYLKPPGGGPAGVGEQLEALALLVGALTIAVPGGLVAVAAYRGRRRPELVLGVTGFLAFYTVYGYSAARSGGIAQLILVPRFVLPVTPLVIFALAEAAPRWVERLARFDRLRSLDRPQVARRAVAAVIVASVLMTAVAATLLDRESHRSAAIDRTIQATLPDSARMVINDNNMAAHVGPTAGPQTWVDRDVMPPLRLPEMVSYPGPVYLVLLDRTGTRFRRQEKAINDAYLAEAGVWTDLQPVVDRRFPGGAHLRILRSRLS